MGVYIYLFIGKREWGGKGFYGRNKWVSLGKINGLFWK